jgi:hypothetical protein
VPAIGKVEVLLVLLRIQSIGQKIRPEFFRKPWPFESVDGFRMWRMNLPFIAVDSK